MTMAARKPPAKPHGKDHPQPPPMTIGSSYHVRSLGSRDVMIETKGKFLGIVSVGTIDGLALELDKAAHPDVAGKTRVIPTHMVLAIDVIEQAAAPEESAEEAHMHYT